MKEIKLYRRELFITLLFALIINFVCSASSKNKVPNYSAVIRTVANLQRNYNRHNSNKLSKNSKIFKTNIYKREKSNIVNSSQKKYQDWEGGYGIKIEYHDIIENLDFAQMEIKFLMLKNLSTLGKGSVISNVKISQIQINSGPEQGIVFDFADQKISQEIKKILIKKDINRNTWYLPYRLARTEFNFNNGINTLKFLETWLIDENNQIIKFTIIFPLFKWSVGILHFNGNTIKNLLNKKRLEIPESSNIIKKKMFEIAHTIITQAMLKEFIKAQDLKEAISHVKKYNQKKQKLEKLIISDSNKKKARTLSEEIENYENYVDTLNTKLEEIEKNSIEKIYKNHENNEESQIFLNEYQDQDKEEDEDTFDDFWYLI